MINQRLFIPKFLNNSKMLLSSSRAIFIRALVLFFFQQRTTFLHLSTFLFHFYQSINFLIHSYLIHKIKNRKIIILSQRLRSLTLCSCHVMFWVRVQLQSLHWEVSIMLLYCINAVLIQSYLFLIQMETTMQKLREFEQKIICYKKF